MNDIFIKSALIIGAAPEQDISYISRLINGLQPELIICADGGLRTARKLSIIPHVIIGDGDSYGELNSDKSGNAHDTAAVFEAVRGEANEISVAEIIKLPAEKDDTDLRSCVDKAISKGAREIFLTGVCGGRADHFLANIHLLEYINDSGARGFIYDANNIIGFHAGGRLALTNRPEFKYFSIIPADIVIANVTLEGFKYPLKNAAIDRGTPLTISNEILSDSPKVSFEGRAYYIFSRD